MKLRDKLLLKVILDIKIKLLSVIESPKFTQIATKTLPQALRLHKSLSRSEVEALNDQLKEDPWNLSINRLKHGWVEIALIVYEKTRKGYIKYYEDKLNEY